MRRHRLLSLLVLVVGGAASCGEGADRSTPGLADPVGRDESVWASAEWIHGPGIHVRLCYRKHASCLDERWLGIEFVNTTPQPVPLRGIQFHFDYDVHGRSSGGLFNSHAGVLPARWRSLWHEPVLLAPGVTPLWGGLSALAGARLPLAATRNDRLRIRVSGHVQCGHDTSHLHTQAGEVEVELSWLSLDDEGIAVLRKRLDVLLEAPRGSDAPVGRIASWLRKPDVSRHLEPEGLIAALERRRPGSVARTALARHLAQHFSEEDVVRHHFLERLESGDLDALADLSQSDAPWGAQSPGIWSPAYVEPITRLIETTPDAWTHAFALFEAHGTPQASDPDLAARLRAAVLARDVLSPPEGEPTHTWPRYPDGFEFLARCRDPKAIHELVAKLADVSIQRSLEGYPRSWSFPYRPEGGWKVRPPPARTCDFALDAILRLQGADLRKAYEDAGFADLHLDDPDATDEDNARAIGAMRDRMIAALRQELTR